MRIIAGAKRGTNLTECKSEAVRPTSNRTREALFNILTGGRLPFDIHGSQLIDACAGSGSLGLEALSRGATVAVFCEWDRDALLVLKKNIQKLGFDHQAKYCQVISQACGHGMPLPPSLYYVMRLMIVALPPKLSRGSQDWALCSPPALLHERIGIVKA